MSTQLHRRRDHPDTSGLVVDVLGADRVAFARIEGALDGGNAHRLLAVLASLVAGGGRDVVLDCGSLRSCDPSGMRPLEQIHRLLPPGGTCTLVRPRPAVRRAIDEAGLSGLVEMTPEVVAVVTGPAPDLRSSTALP